MDRKRWRTPNELVSLRKTKKAKIGVSDASTSRAPEVESSSTEDGSSQDADLQPQTYHLDEMPLAADTDWCLKSKLRIVSDEAYGWLDASKPQHEAKAFSGMQWNIDQQPTKTLDDLLVLFHQSLIVWIHPFFSFLDVFPRVETKSQQTAAISDKEASLLKDHWSTSFHSVFKLLQHGYCSYFYVCANTMTILFLSKQVVSCGDQDVALIAPTTSGFRAAMKKQGLKFALPLAAVERSDELEELEGANNWLKSMVTPEAKISFPHAETLDNFSTLVAVKGADFNALGNFILNNKTFVPREGKFAGIPPTLLAPTQFLGATMHILKMKRTQVKEMNENGRLSDKHCVDISGPIMPHNLQLLKAVFKSAQKHYSIQHDKMAPNFNQYFQSKQ